MWLFQAINPILVKNQELRTITSWSILSKKLSYKLIVWFSHHRLFKKKKIAGEKKTCVWEKIIKFNSKKSKRWQYVLKKSIVVFTSPIKLIFSFDNSFFLIFFSSFGMVYVRNTICYFNFFEQRQELNVSCIQSLFLRATNYYKNVRFIELLLFFIGLNSDLKNNKIKIKSHNPNPNLFSFLNWALEISPF